MEQLLRTSSNVRKRTSAQARNSRGQWQSQIAPNQNPPLMAHQNPPLVAYRNTPPPVAHRNNHPPSLTHRNQPPPVAHQNRGNVHELPFNIPPRHVPHMFPIPLHFNPQPQRFHEPPPQNNPSKRSSSSKQRKIPSHIKYSNGATVTMPPECFGTNCWEQMQLYEIKLKEVDNLLAVKDLNVKDLTKLAVGQSAEMGKMALKLKMQESESEDMGNFYRGEIIRLNDLVLDYQKNEEEYKACIATHQENDKSLRITVKELLDFFKKVNGEYKEGVAKLTDEYSESSEKESLGEREAETEPEPEESSDTANEAQSVIEQVEKEKSKFCETTTALVELTEKGFEQCLKTIETLEEENKEKMAAAVPPVVKIHLKKVKSRSRIGSGSESFEESSSSSPPHHDFSQSGDGEWNIVSPNPEEGESVEQYDDEDIEEMLSEPGTPPPFLHPFDEEPIEACTERSRSYHHKIKRRRTEEILPERGYQHEEVDQEEEVSCKVRGNKVGGKKKAGKDSGELLGKKIAVNKKFVGQIEVQHKKRIGKDRDENGRRAVNTKEVEMCQPYVMTDDVSCSAIFGDQREKCLEGDEPVSEIFCKLCGKTFKTNRQLRRHRSKKYDCNQNDSDEGELRDV